jgi:AraC-like DNA-binding protein
METAPLRITRSDEGPVPWTMVERAPHRLLKGIVTAYEGYTEDAAGFPPRVETASTTVPLIISFESTFRVLDPRAPEGPVIPPGGFLAGVFDGPVLVSAIGASNCLQANFTPIGARLFFGRPMHELANRTLAIDDILGPEARVTVERLRATSDWEARFAILDRAILDRMSRVEAPPRFVVSAYSTLRRTAGTADIATVASEVDRSPRQLIDGFRDHIGFPPKVVARILRFNRALRLLPDAPTGSWSDLAMASGYYDQAHFNRDFRAFAGSSPGEYLRRLMPAGGVIGG